MPLAHLRVLDFGHTIMGPCAGLLFADLGADVIKIEPVDGDPTRTLPGFAIGFFSVFNRNKRSLAIDLKNPAGIAAAHRLIASADVMLENYGPGTAERLGIGWDTVKAINPRLVYLGLKGYLAGPYEKRGALDEVVQMQTGIAYMTGPPGQPLRAGAPIVDILGAVFGVVGALAALRERDRTGKGSRVGSALFESAAFMLAPYVAGGALMGEPLKPMPARRGAWAVYEVFTAKDGAQFFLGVTSNAHWSRFCAAFALNELASDSRLVTNASRSKERAWLIPHLAKIFATLSIDDILTRCEHASLPFARVGRPEELCSDAHLRAGGGLVQTILARANDAAQTVGLPGLPLEFGEARSRPALYRQPPEVGEHSDEILREAGLSAEERSKLIAGGMVVAGHRKETA
jgi:crotonobetainyl-CoA:carnitine CoA-transferase CaiB-like acyl-CoA transferase